MATGVSIGILANRQNTYRVPVLLDIEADTELAIVHCEYGAEQLTEELNLNLAVNELAVADRKLTFTDDCTPEVRSIMRYSRISPIPTRATYFTPPFEYGRIVSVSCFCRSSRTIRVGFIIPSEDTGLAKNVRIGIREFVAIATGLIAVVRVDIHVERNPFEVGDVIKVRLSENADVHLGGIHLNTLQTEHRCAIRANCGNNILCRQSIPISQ